MTMKKLIVIVITAVLSVLVITVLAQTEGGQEGSGATEKSAGAQESTQQKYLDAVQEKRSDRRFYRRPRYRTRDYDLRAEEVTPPVSGSMQDIVNYLMRKDGENTRRIETLEATVAKLEAEFRRNSGIERSHWSKVGDLEDKVRLLVRAERKRRRAEGAEESEGLGEVESGEEYEKSEEMVGEEME
jgi:type II secretory pathway pseudopilin PulG